MALKKIFSSLRDGMSGVADWFPVIASQEEQDAATRTEAIKAKLSQRGKSLEATPTETNSAELTGASHE